MPSAVQLASSEWLITQTREIGPLTLPHMPVHLSVAEQLHRAVAMLAITRFSALDGVCVSTQRLAG